MLSKAFLMQLLLEPKLVNLTSFPDMVYDSPGQVRSIEIKPEDFMIISIVDPETSISPLRVTV